MKRTPFLAGFIVALCLCFASDSFAADGWASMDGGTTGGAGGTVVTVDNADDFVNYVQNTKQAPYIIYVSGHIILPSTSIRVRGNKTIIGLPGSHITGNLKSYRLEESNNIFRYLDMDNYDKVGDGDCITIDSANHIWIDHCTFTDGGDGNVDIKNGSDYITLSWCIFKYTRDSGHNFTNLVGHDDDNGDKDANHLLITFHHNWYSTMCKERMPRVRFGRVHVYNNYYSDLLAGGYCIGVGVESNIRVENNYFDAVPNPWEDKYTGYGADGHLGWNTGNVFNECLIPTDIPNNYATIFTPPYAYTLDDGQNVPAIVQYGAGVNGHEGEPPHWFFTVYGDFDRSGIVDMNDLATFTNYWLETDCNQVFDADYDGDCNVNNYEFALFADNWKYIPPDMVPPAAPTDLWALDGNATVRLDWDDNNEPDFEGYNIYRSTTSGSGYSKLNGSLLTDSNYIDNTVSNGTMYYYVATAIDTNSNESSNSVEACALPDSNGPSIVLQEKAMGFCDVDGLVENEWAGYTGWGYANTVNALGNGVDWSVNILTAGTYTFTWRYANASGDRPAKLIVNGDTVLTEVAFPASGASTTYIMTTPVTVDLTAGLKSIRLEANTSSGLVNVDYLSIAGENLLPASCP